MSKLTLALAQCNPTVGAITDNMEMIRRYYDEAIAKGVDIILFPELAITGYPPEDLLLRPEFRAQAIRAQAQLMEETQGKGTAILIGNVREQNGDIYNSLFLLADGRIAHQQDKLHLPNYGVFDEARIFTKGALPDIFEINGVRLGAIICEDTWSGHVSGHVAKNGAQLLLSINASPYERTKPDTRQRITRDRVRETGLPLVYLNILGGNDDIVFDGGSFVKSSDGKMRGALPYHEEVLAFVTFEDGKLYCEDFPDVQDVCIEEIMYNTLVMGLRDYVHKSGFTKGLIGLSGGIDSAIVAAIAVDALGKDNVHGIRLPSRYTSDHSMEDAEESAKLLGIQMDTVPIEPGVEAYDAMLGDLFEGMSPDVTEENIQSRIRGNLLMGVSNKMGSLLINTSNKSEIAVGYGTLYGDMCGAFSPLKDVYKTQVYDLAKWRNTQGQAVPERSITKAPTAELKPDQKDSDSLPDYDVLDKILRGLIEERCSVTEIINRGFEREVVEKVKHLLYSSEYKRRQAPPGVKITSMVFGKDWRYPIAHKAKSY